MRLLIIYLYILMTFGFVCADVKSTSGQIKMDVDNNGVNEAVLNSSGLSIGSIGSANLNVSGNALVNELSVGINTSGSNLHVTGTWAKSYETVTGNTTLSVNHSMILINLAAAATEVDIQMPAASSSINKILQIKYIAGSVNAHIRAVEGIDSAFRITLNSSSSDYPSHIKVFSSGEQWYLLGGLGDATSNGLVSLSDNLLGHWPFDEKEGLVAHDVSGQGHHATMQGRDDVVWTDGQVAGAVTLDGSGEYFFAGDSLSFNDIDFSVSFWEKRASIGSNHYVVGHGYAASSQGLHLGFRSSNVMTFAFWGNDYDTDGTYITAEWRHWVFTYDRSTGDRIMYLNGSLLKTNNTGTPYNPTNNTLFLGANYNASSVFDGEIDDIRIYNKILDLDQIQELYELTSYTFAPVLSSATASDINNTVGIGAGDNLTLKFSEATNEPDMSTKTLIDQTIFWYDKSLGTNYSGTWSDNQTLVITVSDATGATIDVGDSIKINANSSFTALNDSSLWIHGQATIDGLFTWFTFTDNLIAHYTFDNPDEKLIFDQAGNNHLAIQGNGTYYPTGKLGLGLFFDSDLVGTTTGVNVYNQSQTTMFWEKRGSTISSDQSHVRVGTGESDGLSYRMKYRSDNKYAMDFWGANRSTTQTYTNSEWRHWAYSFDNDLRTQRLYLNGNLILSESSDSHYFLGDDRIYVGGFSGSSELLNGTMDDVRIYDRVLTQAEIQQVYHNTTVPTIEPELASVYARDPDFDDDGLSNGDNLLLTFSYATNTPTVTTKADLDQILSFHDYSLGTDYSGTWSDNHTLEISIVDSTNGNVQIGGLVSILESGDLQRLGGSSSNVDTSGIEIKGTWGRVASTNLIAYYNFNESSGLVAMDQISGNHGTLDSGMDDSNWVDGYIGNGLRFDEGDDEVTIAGGNFNNFSGNSFAFSVWEKRDDTGSNDYIFGQGTNSGSLGLHFGYRNTDVFTLAFWSNDLNTNINFVADQWRHWVMSYEASTLTQNLYLNGELVGTRTASGNYVGTGTLYIGSRFGSNHFDGILDEVKIYDRSLTDDEVRQLYNP